MNARKNRGQVVRSPDPTLKAETQRPASKLGEKSKSVRPNAKPVDFMSKNRGTTFLVAAVNQSCDNKITKI